MNQKKKKDLKSHYVYLTDFLITTSAVFVSKVHKKEEELLKQLISLFDKLSYKMQKGFCSDAGGSVKL